MRLFDPHAAPTHAADPCSADTAADQNVLHGFSEP
jgi:hypothetical protein